MKVVGCEGLNSKSSPWPKLFYLLLILSCLFLSSCSQNKPIATVKNFDDKQKVIINLKRSEDLSKNQLNKFNKALKLINSYVNTREFKNMILKGPDSLNTITPNESETNLCNKQSRATYTYNTVKGKCFNNKDIYKVIKSAEWSLSVKVKPSWGLSNCNQFWSNAVGALEGETIVTKECIFNDMSVELLAGFLIHEYLHVIGFRHPYQPSPNRKNTIPYFIGDNAIQFFNKKI